MNAAISEAEFGTLYEQLHAPLRRHVLRMCKDPDLAEDLTAETFARAWRYHGSFQTQEGASTSSWLYRIATNVMIDHARRNQHRPQLVDLELHTATLAGESAPSWPVDRPTLTAALESLEPHWREHLQLTYFQGLTSGQVGAALGESGSTAFAHQHAAEDALRVALGRPPLANVRPIRALRPRAGASVEPDLPPLPAHEFRELVVPEDDQAAIRLYLDALRDGWQIIGRRRTVAGILPVVIARRPRPAAELRRAA